MTKGIVLVLSGPAGSGKSTVRQKLLESGLNFHYSVSDTTRESRPGEKDGVDYGFISFERFRQGITEGKYYEYAEYAGNYYGTPVSQLTPYIENGINVILEIEVQGAMQVRQKDPDAVLVMLLPPSYSVLERRLRNRKTESEEVIARRLIKAREEIGYFPHYDYFILNEENKVEECVNRLKGIAESEQAKTKNNAEFPQLFLNN